MRHSTKRNTRTSIDTDIIMQSVYTAILKDARYALSDEDFMPAARPRYEEAENYLCHPSRFKYRRQVNLFYKRYIRETEAITQEERESRTASKFLATQERIAVYRPFTYRSRLVIQRARKIIKNILGPYCEQEHIYHCRFGRRAALGLPMKESYLHNRVRVLTGSPDHVRWWDEKVMDHEEDPLTGVYYPADPLLYASTKGAPRVPTHDLELSTVPKAWDKKRVIMKNTVIGGYYSVGLGDYMVALWKDKGYNLSRRPEKHRAWVKDMSVNRVEVTADVQSASDSYTCALMNALFPRDWFTAMNRGRLRSLRIGDIKTQMSSFMTMGIGFTFPAQSIAFYAILKAVQELLHIRGRVSVFGDDLIYPRMMHGHVVEILNDLNFLINEEKTFSHVEFRESCGADYYAGVDVRPYQPEGEHKVLSGNRALAWLYKMWNGLSCRWQYEELSAAFDLLEKLCLQFTSKIHIVPLDQPAYAGVHIRDSFSFPNLFYHVPLYDRSTYSKFYKCLVNERNFREVVSQVPYLWDRIRSKTVGEPEDTWAKYLDEADLPLLYWRKVKGRKKKYFPGRAPKPTWVLRPFVIEKGDNGSIKQGFTLKPEIHCCDKVGSKCDILNRH